jgi:hypothetical protein
LRRSLLGSRPSGAFESARTLARALLIRNQGVPRSAVAPGDGAAEGLLYGEIRPFHFVNRQTSVYFVGDLRSFDSAEPIVRKSPYVAHSDDDRFLRSMERNDDVRKSLQEAATNFVGPGITLRPRARLW